MFVVKRNQIEAFRIPMREAARDKLIAELASEDDNTYVSPDKATLVQTDEEGNKTTIAYSADVLPVTITKPSGVQYSMQYDQEGRLSQVEFPDGEQLQVKFANGQLQQVATSPAKSYQFEYQKGLLTRVVYPGKKSQQFIYNDIGQIRAIIDRTGQANEFIRTQDGRLLAIKDPLNRSVRFMYDESGLLRDLIFPDRTQQSYQYDEDEDVLFVQLRDGKSFSQHYENNLIRQLSWEHGPTVRFAYNDQSQPTLIESGEYSVAFTYDDQKRLAAEQNPFGETTFQYDKSSRPTRLTLPTGLAITYEYDTDNRVTALHVDGQTTQYIYNEQDLLAEIRYPNGVTEYQQRNHTEGLRHVRVQDTRGQLLSEQQYAYDNWDRLNKYQDTTSKQNYHLTYDPECRLTGLFDPQTRQPYERFTYDAKGNLAVFNGHPIVVGDMDEIRQIGRANVYYDALSNINRLRSPKGKLALSFARNSTLTTVQIDAETWHYTYDGIGRRTSKTDGRQLWRFAWAGSQMVTEEYHSGPGASPLTRDYIYLPDSQVPVGFREGGQLYWMQADVRGAITRVFGPKGQLVWHGSYSAFGSLTVHTAQIRQPWRLMGQYEDEETGLYYNLARYYCPWLTTYLSLDPEWLNSETYYYSYARNDPYNRADPIGNIAPLIAFALVVAGGAILGAAISGGIALYKGENVGAAMVHGAISGGAATAGALLGGLPGMVVGAFVGGFAGSLAEQAVKGQELCYTCALANAAVEALTALVLGPIFGRIGRGLGKLIGPTAVGRSMATVLAQAEVGAQQIKGAVSRAFGRGVPVVPPVAPVEPVVEEAIPAEKPPSEGSLTGKKTQIGTDEDLEVQRSLQRENEAAETLAKNGYNVEQNPSIPETGKNPDYKLNGEVYDCYSPSGNKPRNIASVIKDKVAVEQAKRVVLNLDDSPVDINAVRDQLHNYPIEGLEEVIVVKDGQVISIFP